MSKKLEYERQKALKHQQKIQQKIDSENPRMDFDFEVGYLSNFGIILNTQISVTESYARVLSHLGKTVPHPVVCRMLVDTGATKSMLKHSFAEQAGLKLISENTPIRGVGVDTTGKTYMGRVQFFTSSKVHQGTQHMMFIDCQIVSGHLNNNPILDGLIGRDVLRFFDLRVNGMTGKVSMTYLKDLVEKAKLG